MHILSISEALDPCDCLISIVSVEKSVKKQCKNSARQPQGYGQNVHTAPEADDIYVLTVVYY